MNHTSLLSDRELIRQYQTGDQHAFEILLQRTRPKVFAMIMMLVKDKCMAEDIFQETCIKVVNDLRKNRYEDSNRFTWWVMRIARNLCYDYFRECKRRPVMVDSDKRDIIAELPVSTFENAQAKMERTESHQVVRRLISQLPEKHKEVLILRHYSNLSFKEISRITGTNLNTCLGRMRYALRHLHRMSASEPALN